MFGCKPGTGMVRGSIYSALMCFMMLAKLHAQQPVAAMNDTLKEIVIESRVPIKISGDTVTYAIDSTKNPLATVEDVLRKLPGISIEGAGGKIMMQGKPVEKILLNGKEYPASDIRVLTQNMPAEMLDKVQVSDWYDDTEQLSGIKKESETKAINLLLKKQYEKGLYTRALGGYGTEGRYQAGAFSNFMKNALLATLTASLNNTPVENIWGNEASLKGAQFPGISTRSNISCNLSYEASEKLKLSLTYEAGKSKTFLNQRYYRSTFLSGDSSLINNGYSDGITNTLQQSLRLQSRYTISDKLTMITKAFAGWQKNENNIRTEDATAYTEDAPAFYRSSQQDNSTNKPTFSVQNIFLKRFKKSRRSLSLTLEAGYTNVMENGLLENTNQYFSPDKTIRNSIEKNGSNNLLNTLVSLQYTEPLTARSVLNIKYTYSTNTGRNDREVWQDNDYQYFDTQQSRSYHHQYVENPFSISYQYRSRTFTAVAGFNIKYYDRKMNIFSSAGTLMKSSGVNFYPDVSLKYTFSKNSNIRLNYRNGVEVPGLAQLQPVPDYTDSLNVYIGNPELRPEISHNISISYNYFSARSQKMLTATLRGRSIAHKIINRIDLNSSTSITSPINAGNVYTTDLLLNYSQHILPSKLKVSATLSAGTGQSISITNGQLQSVNSYNFQPSTKLTILNTFFEGECTYGYKLNLVSASLSDKGRTLQTHTAGLSGIIFLPLQMRLGLSLNYVYNAGLSDGLGRQFFPANISLEKSFIKPKGLCLRIQAYNVFDNYPNVQRLAGDNFIEDRSSGQPGRYCLLSLIYNLWK